MVGSDRPQMKTCRMRIAYWRLIFTNTHSEYLILIVFFAGTMVTRTQLNVNVIGTLPVLFVHAHFMRTRQIKYCLRYIYIYIYIYTHTHNVGAIFYSFVTWTLVEIL